MAPDHGRVEIRSYRAVFDLERRLYRIDRFRLNPSGVPVRGLVCLAALVLTVLGAERLPGVGGALGAVPWQLRYAGLPGLGAALLTILRIDGRPAHVALASIARFACAARYLSGFARGPRPGGGWTPAPLGVIADGSGGGPCRLAFRGPGAVLVRAPHRLGRRRRRLVLAVDGAGAVSPRALVVRRGVTVDVRVGG